MHVCKGKKNGLNRIASRGRLVEKKSGESSLCIRSFSILRVFLKVSMAISFSFVPIFIHWLLSIPLWLLFPSIWPLSSQVWLLSLMDNRHFLLLAIKFKICHYPAKFDYYLHHFCEYLCPKKIKMLPCTGSKTKNMQFIPCNCSFGIARTKPY